MPASRLSQPRISLNKLAEFMTSRKASRHRAILRDQKFPQDYKTVYHKEASEAVSSCIASSLENLSALDRAVAVLEQMNPDKIGAQRRVNANLNAIDRFRQMLDDVDLGSALPALGENSPAKIRLQNVDISVRPEIILSGKGKKGTKLVGAMKLHFSTTNPLNEEAGAYASAMLQEWSKTFLTEGETFGPYCYVIDVGSSKIHKVIKATTARMKDIESACRNIASLWPDITESD